jgi:hypothetical protein
MHVLGADPINEVGHGQYQRDRAEQRRHTRDRMEQMERSWSGPEAPWQGPLFPAQPKTARDARKRHDLVPDGGVAEIANDFCRHEDIDRRADFVQAAKDVQRVMLESSEWLRREKKINRYAIGHGITTGHCRMLAKGFAHP